MNLITGKLEAHTNGNGNVITADGEKIYIHSSNINKAFDKDTVEVSIIDFTHWGAREGKVVNITKRYTEQFTGIVQKVKNYGFVIPDSKRISNHFFLSKDQAKKCKIGERLLVKITNWKRGKNPGCKIIKSLGMFGENESEISSIIYEYNLETDFPKKVEQECKRIDRNISQEEISKRRDFRDIFTCTIDPNDSRDFDDGISYQELENGYEIGIHIADVSHYIKPNMETYKEAQNRGTSIYLVDRVISMLPVILSNGLCSLRPNEDKLTFSVIIKLDNDFNIIDKNICKTIINSNRRFTYDEVQGVILGSEDNNKYEIDILNKIAQIFRKKRTSLLFNSSEMRFKLDDKSVPISVEQEVSNESHQLIEEMMLIANKVVGEYLHTKGTGVYRNHDEPNNDKILELCGLSKSFGFNLDMSDIRDGINKLNIDVKDTPYENMISTLAIRAMDKAKYSINNIGHYGLNFKYYTHFTSPIRRMADVLSHQLLSHYLGIEKMDINKSQIEETCVHINEQELNAKKAQRDSIKYKQIEYLLSRIGKTYTATITGMNNWGIFAQINENHCEGMIKRDTLNGEIDRDNYQVLMNDNTIYHLGDTINIKVFKVSLFSKEIEFKII